MPLPSTVVMLRCPAELLERVDAQGRGRAQFIKAATEYYLRVLETGREAEVVRRVEKVALMDAEGNVIKVL